MKVSRSVWTKEKKMHWISSKGESSSSSGNLYPSLSNEWFADGIFLGTECKRGLSQIKTSRCFPSRRATLFLSLLSDSFCGQSNFKLLAIYASCFTSVFCSWRRLEGRRGREGGGDVITSVIRFKVAWLPQVGGVIEWNMGRRQASKCPSILVFHANSFLLIDSWYWNTLIYISRTPPWTMASTLTSCR